MTRFTTRPLGKQDRGSFVSGNDRIDAYFRSSVSEDVKRDYAACYLLIESETDRIAGFYTLSATSIPLPEVPEGWARKLPRYPTVPAILIGWLGRDLAFRGQAIGSALLMDAIERASALPVGAHALVGDAIDEAAARFYRDHQFETLATGRMILAMATARSLLG